MKKLSKVSKLLSFGRSIPALESSQPIALAQEVAAKMSPDQVSSCLSGAWGPRTFMPVKERFEKLKQKEIRLINTSANFWLSELVY